MFPQAESGSAGAGPGAVVWGAEGARWALPLLGAEMSWKYELEIGVCQCVEGDVGEWALTPMLEPAGQQSLLAMPVGVCTRILLWASAGSPEAAQPQLFLPGGWRISAEVSSPSS